jgi:hypothetical protein
MPRKRGAGRPGPFALACHPVPYCGPEKGPSWKHPADFSVAVVQIVGPIAPESAPDSFGRHLSFEILLIPRLGGVMVDRWCIPWVHKRAAQLYRLMAVFLHNVKVRDGGQYASGVSFRFDTERTAL